MITSSHSFGIYKPWTRLLRALYEIDAHGVYTRGPYNNVWKGVGSLPYSASTVLCSISFKSFL